MLLINDDDVRGLDWRGLDVVSGSLVALTPASKGILRVRRAGAIFL